VAFPSAALSSSASSSASRLTAPAVFEDLAFPGPDALLGDLELPGRVGSSDLTGQDREHDPYLLLRRERRWTTHHRLLGSELNYVPCHKV
jgi:hypothetical protein